MIRNLTVAGPNGVPTSNNGTGTAPGQVNDGFTTKITPMGGSQEYEAKLTALRTAIDEGEASGIADGDVLRVSGKRSAYRPRNLSRWVASASHAAPITIC